MKHRIDMVIDELIKMELADAQKEYGKTFHSPHEGFAVIAEEADETDLDVARLKDAMAGLWDDVKADAISVDSMCSLSQMRRAAKHLASEAIQVAAMCDKMEKSVRAWHE